MECFQELKMLNEKIFFSKKLQNYSKGKKRDQDVWKTNFCVASFVLVKIEIRDNKIEWRILKKRISNKVEANRKF